MAEQGTGTTLTFGTSGFTSELLSIGGPGWSRESVDTAHMGTTTSLSFEPADLYDGGELTVEFAFDPSKTPPLTAVVETITVDWAGLGAGQIWSFSGFMTNYEPGSAAINERMTASATLKVTGDISIT